jgi:3-oxoacyl-[acyl-carrier protein] reductase
MDLGIAGRWAIVCASSRGLGAACATALAHEGVNVVLNGRDEEALSGAATELRRSAPGEVRTVAGDVRAAETHAALLDRCPRPDILVTNAGGPPAGRVREATDQDWDYGLQANLFAPLALIRATVDGMCERRFGRIVNITSAMVSTPRPTMAVSSGVRAALTAVVKGLSIDVAPFNVTINNLLPERMDTERQRHMATVAAQRDAITYDEARRRQLASIAARRLGEPRELGATCAFLCGEAAGFLSGQNLHLDGGSYPGLI